jgi:hypothetical protein
MATAVTLLQFSTREHPNTALQLAPALAVPEPGSTARAAAALSTAAPLPILSTHLFISFAPLLSQFCEWPNPARQGASSAPAGDATPVTASGMLG